jgi:transposase
MLEPGTDRSAGEVLPHAPPAIAEWVGRLRRRFGDRPIAVALEQQRGPLMALLLQFPTLVLFPLNPHQLASYRKALFPGGSKSDPEDAELLARFVREHHPRLRAWRPDDETTRQLARLCELRRHAVDARTRLVQQLTDALKQYFPLALEIAGALTGAKALALLRRWPTLRQLQRANPASLRRFFREHGVRDAGRLEELIRTIRKAAPLTADPALIEPCAMWVHVLIAQIRTLNDGVAAFEEEGERLFRAHPDAPLFESLPGAGAALAPRLLAALGTQRDRYQSARDVQSYSGIAPVTRRSGKSLHVQRRRACPKFLRQTFHEFANYAARFSRWSRAYYLSQRSRGKKHQAAIRSLAYKWIRILYQVWKTHTPYDETRYLQQLQKHNSPILNFLETT